MLLIDDPFFGDSPTLKKVVGHIAFISNSELLFTSESNSLIVIESESKLKQYAKTCGFTHLSRTRVIRGNDILIALRNGRAITFDFKAYRNYYNLAVELNFKARKPEELFHLTKEGLQFAELSNLPELDI